MDEFVAAVLDDVAWDMRDLGRNILGVALRSEVEIRLVPGVLAVHALLLEANGETLAQLPPWLDRVHRQMGSDAQFFTEVGVGTCRDRFLLINIQGC